MTYIKYFTTIVLFFTSLIYCFGQDINSQSDVDALDPNTTEITGYLYINGTSGNPITNLDNLSNLTSVGGSVTITNNDALTNIDNLSSLTSIGGSLLIRNNTNLANLDGLSNLNSTIGYLEVTLNPVLINLDGLSNLVSVGSQVEIEENNALTNINGLSNLVSIGGGLYIESNPNLTDIDGLLNLTSIDGSLYIKFNNSLTTINGLSNLASSIVRLEIENNSSLTSINGLSSLANIVFNVTITNNASLVDIDGLSSLDSIGIYLEIEDNLTLENIDGLSNLSSIGSHVRIVQNTSLANIDGLSNIPSIPLRIYIAANPSLENIDGLSSLNSVGDLSIANNIFLKNIDGLLNLTTIGGQFYMVNNNSLTNVDGASNITSVDDFFSLSYCPALTNVDGLSNLNSVNGTFDLKNNESLISCCGVHNLLNTPGAITGEIDIANNPSECSNQSEILNAGSCGLTVKIFNDISQDCINDNDEIGISNRQFIIQPGDIIGETNTAGRWFLDDIPLGDYTITIDTSGTWSPTCPITQSFTVIDPIDETMIPSFGLISTEPCAAPDISVHMPFMRPCFENQKIYIQACNTNNATGVLENAFVVLELDPLLTPTSSLIPYTDLGNHLYQFDIGTLNPGMCSDFWMETSLSCDAELGQGLCMEAQLFPAESCVFDDIPNPLEDCNTIWDMSSLTINGYCENDSIFFEIQNNGTGDMTCFSPVRVYVNGNLIILDSVQLVSTEIAVFSFLGNGQSWRLETDQHPLHPGNSQPNAMVEGCGGSIATFSSFINAMPQDDADPIVDIYCGIVTGSYDPNDKTGFPLGVNESNDILPNQKIEYLIRFQNTGTDTAFTVVIRDVLSENFDIFSVQSGVSSHDYNFTINAAREMEWTFNDILLVDSFTNEPGSHGFIKFTVDQIPNLAEGTVLENTAGIYFDFNDPIITNTSQHTINYFTPNIIATTNISDQGCNDYLSPSGNYTWSNSGTYYDVIETENGDSVVIVDLMVTMVDLTITNMGGGTLVANLNDAEYQWLDCNNNSNPIEGATNQDFTTTETIGDYAVQITLDGCKVTSDCFSINTIGVVDHEFANAVNIHPNPTNKHIFVDLGEKYQATNFTVRNILGQTIIKQQINSNEFHFEINAAKGLYLLEIETNTGQNATFKILKK